MAWDVCYELHPGEDLHDGVTFERFLEAVGGHARANILYDPSHFVLQQLDYLAFIDIYHDRIKAFHVKDAEFRPNGRAGVYGSYSAWVDRPGRFRSLGDGQVDFGAIFSKFAQYGYAGWAVLEWECCLKHPEDGAAEGAPFIARHMIRKAERAFDDFADRGRMRRWSAARWASRPIDDHTITTTGDRIMAGEPATQYNNRAIFWICVLALFSAALSFSIRTGASGAIKAALLDTTVPLHSGEMIAAALGYSFLGFAISLLVISPLLDMIGAKRVILLAAACYILGPVLILLSPQAGGIEAVYRLLTIGMVVSGVAWGATEASINRSPPRFTRRKRPSG